MKCKYIFCPGFRIIINIVASLADSICRHPDVTLESGLVLNTYWELFPITFWLEKISEDELTLATQWLPCIPGAGSSHR